MRILNREIKIEKVEKEKKPMTCDQVDQMVDGVCPDDTPVKEKKSKKKLGRRLLCAAGAFGAGAATAAAVLLRKGDDPDEEEAGADDAADEAPFEAAGENEATY